MLDLITSWYRFRLDSPNYGTKINAAKSIVHRAANKSFEILLEHFNDNNTWVRSEALRLAAQIGDKRAEASMIRCLSDKHPYIRMEAASSLALLVGPKANEFLINMLTDSEERIRLEVVQLLKKYPDPKAITPLSNLLNDSDRNVREESKVALTSLGLTKKQVLDETKKVMLHDLKHPKKHGDFERAFWGLTHFADSDKDLLDLLTLYLQNAYKEKDRNRYDVVAKLCELRSKQAIKILLDESNEFLHYLHRPQFTRLLRYCDEEKDIRHALEILSNEFQTMSKPIYEDKEDFYTEDLGGNTFTAKPAGTFSKVCVAGDFDYQDVSDTIENLKKKVMIAN